MTAPSLSLYFDAPYRTTISSVLLSTQSNTPFQLNTHYRGDNTTQRTRGHTHTHTQEKRKKKYIIMFWRRSDKMCEWTLWTWWQNIPQQFLYCLVKKKVYFILCQLHDSPLLALVQIFHQCHVHTHPPTHTHRGLSTTVKTCVCCCCCFCLFFVNSVWNRTFK